MFTRIMMLCACCCAADRPGRLWRGPVRPECDQELPDSHPWSGISLSDPHHQRAGETADDCWWDVHLHVHPFIKKKKSRQSSRVWRWMLLSNPKALIYKHNKLFDQHDWSHTINHQSLKSLKVSLWWNISSCVTSVCACCRGREGAVSGGDKESEAVSGPVPPAQPVGTGSLHLWDGEGLPSVCCWEGRSSSPLYT